MQQRFLIALATLGEPPLLVLDEPTSALDPVTAAAMMARLVDQTRARKGAMLIVTHNEALAANISSRVVRLEGGRIAHSLAATTSGDTRRVLPQPAAARSGEKVLDVAGLSVQLGDREVLRDVQLDLHAGEFLFVLGESGAGKTTLLKALTGLVPTTARIAKPHRPALVLQDPMAALCPAHRVIDAVAEPLRAAGMTRALAHERAARAVDETGLPASLLTRLPNRLSLGQAQRVCIARALVSRPGLVLMDEPLSALDADSGDGIIALLHRLRDRHGLAFLIVTHDLGFAQDLADRVAVLRDGRLIEKSNARAFFARPASDYGRVLIEAARFLGDLERAA